MYKNVLILVSLVMFLMGCTSQASDEHIVEQQVFKNDSVEHCMYGCVAGMNNFTTITLNEKTVNEVIKPCERFCTVLENQK